MTFVSPLVRGRLLRRYKRFLADIVLDSGEALTVTCPNTGAMIGLAEPGTAIWVSRSSNPKRAYAYTWELCEADVGQGPALVGINTHLPNRIVAETLAQRRMSELADYAEVRREVRYGAESRVDFLLTSGDGRLTYLEVKNVHMMRVPGRAEFPDCVTERGARHLRELASMVEAGHSAAMLYIVQRGDADSFSIAADIDPAYRAAFDAARTAGVKMFAYRCRVSPEGVALDAPLKIGQPLGLVGDDMSSKGNKLGRAS